ncbi:phage holin family protein [Nocardioides coralli]|uniref:phage holin family protein n=1 Tax=Nocardioides coralli TaxID=2872154 RepID=UPI001CA414EF|nr:phage holin family protein [Nocardioides coralli]QZY28985.1 phage holin family protein [Nocardioides coralli]
MRLLTWLVTNVLAVAAAAWLVDGIRFAGPRNWPAELEEKWLTVVAVGVILGLVSSVVKPVVKLLSLPFIVLTLGLFLWVINALMLMLTSWLAGELGLGFRVVDFFWAALLGAVVISVVNWAVDRVLERP